MHCNATGRPAPRIQWRTERFLIRPNPLKYSIVGNVLIIKRFDSLDLGKYTCIASNNFGETNVTVTLKRASKSCLTSIPTLQHFLTLGIIKCRLKSLSVRMTRLAKSTPPSLSNVTTPEIRSRRSCGSLRRISRLETRSSRLSQPTNPTEAFPPCLDSR